MGTEFRGGVADVNVIIVSGEADCLEVATNVDVAGNVVEVVYSGVGFVVGAKDGDGFTNFVRAVDVGDWKEGKKKIHDIRH
jgi:hypothetical protein